MVFPKGKKEGKKGWLLEVTYSKEKIAVF
jgi:hypothetical protein